MSSNSFNPQGFYLERQGNAQAYRVVSFLKAKTILGRDEDADINLNTRIVSRKHTLVEFVDGRMYIENLKSINGTFLNDTKIVQRTEVDVNDLIGIGCNPENLQLNVDRPEFIIFKAVLMEEIVLEDSSDEEKDKEEIVDEVGEQVDKSSDEKEKAIVEEEVPEVPEVHDDQDIDELINDFANNSGIANVLIDEVIELSSAEESEADKNWKEKLSQSRSPPIHRSSSECHASPKETPKTTPKQERMSVDLSPSLPPSPSSSSSSDEGDKIRDCVVQIQIMSQEQVKEFTNREQGSNGSTTSESSEESDHSNRKAINKRKLRNKISQDQKKKASEWRKKLKNVVDSDSDSDGESKVPTKAKQVKATSSKKTHFPKDLECVPLETPSKIMIRRKSISGLAEHTEKQLPKEDSSDKNTKKRRQSTDVSPKAGGSKDDNRPIKEPEVVNEPPKKLMPKRRMTISGTEEIKNKPPILKFKPLPKVPIIEALPMPKRRQSVADVARVPKRRMSTSGDMFSIASNIRNEPPNKKPHVTEFRTAEETETFKKNRKERLRQVADEKAEQKRKEQQELQNQEKTERSVAVVKVKLTEKNRGDFLTNLPGPSTSAAKPVKRLFNLATEQAKSKRKDNESDEESVTKMVEQFRENNVKRRVLVAKVENGVCNNLQFYNSIDHILDVSIEKTPLTTSNLTLNDSPQTTAQCVGFYNPIQSSQPPQQDMQISPADVLNAPLEPQLKLADFVHPGPYSILKDSSMLPRRPARPKYNVRFESIEKLTTVKEYFIDDDLPPSPPQEVEPAQVQDADEADFEQTKAFPLRRSSISYGEYKEKALNRLQASTSNAIQPDNRVASVPTTRPLVSNLPVENQIINRLLAWSPSWLELPTSLKPESFDIKPMPMSYNDLREYQNILEPIIELELLAKVSNTYTKKTRNGQENKQWINLMLDNVASVQEVTRLTFFKTEFVRGYRQGSLVLLKIRNCEGQQEELLFAFVSSPIGPNCETFTVDTKGSPTKMKAVTVVKSCLIMYIRAEIKSMIALRHLKKTDLVKQILNPSTIKPCDNYVSGPLVESPLKLSDTQLKIVRQVARDMMLDARIIAIEGGPGTGKTKVIVASILQLFIMAQKEKRTAPCILVCAMSNHCVDEITASLQPLADALKIEILRTGNSEKLSENILPLSLNHQVQVNRGSRTYKEAKKSFIDSANVVLTTINSSSELLDFGKKFEVCFIDEASQSTDAEILIPLQLNFKNLVLVGDKNQLQPVVNSQALVASNYEKSLFSRISEISDSHEKKPVITLKEQFRMHPEIFKFPNKYFYGDRIQSHPSLTSREPLLKLKPYMMMDIESEQALTQDTSPYNLSEVRFVSHLAEVLARTVPDDLSIAIITPYTRQNIEIKSQLNDKKRIQVYTIDSAQGLEKDIVILSVTRTHGLGFLNNERRLNVALTRAKRALYVCGNFSSLQLNNVWKEMVFDATERGVFHQVRDNLDEAALTTLIEIKK